MRAARLGGALSCGALALCVAGCPRARAVAQEAAVGWGEDDAAAGGDAREAVEHGGAGGDAGIAGPPVLLRGGRPAGFLRFVHLAPGAGRVRFVARSADGYERGAIDAVVDEGSTSGYLPTVNVPHRVRVLPERADPDAGVAQDLAAVLQSDVYNNAGCTVAFGGRAPWVARARRQDPEARRLVRVIDIPRRDQRSVGMLRFMAGVSGAWPLTIEEAGEAVYEGLPFLTITGMRRVSPGAHAFVLRTSSDGALASSDPVRVELPGGEAHTLWLYAGRGRRGAADVRWVLTNDVPPGRIGPDFTGEMPVYR